MVSASAPRGESTEVSIIVERNRRILFDALDALEGEKTIVWDRSLMQRVNIFATPKMLEQHGVKANMALDKYGQTMTTHLVFFLAPTLEAVDLLCQWIDAAKQDTKTLYQVFFIPEAWYVVREKLKERDQGKYQSRLESVKELALFWLPRGGDCLSLADPHIPSKMLINGDWTCLNRCAVAAHDLLSLCDGQIPVFSKGKWAQDVAKMVSRLPQKASSSGQSGALMKINRLIIVDRWLDPLTPMLHQLTYSGLLDEIYGIGMVGSIQVSQTEYDQQQDGDPFAMKTVHMGDEIFHRLKHVHMNAMGIELGGVLSEIKQSEQFDKDKMSIAEYQVLVKKIPQMQKKRANTQVHMRLAEMTKAHVHSKLVDIIRVEKELLDASDGDKVNAFIEECILDAADLSTVLRLVAVHSMTSGGLKPVVLQQYRRMIMQSYGTEALNKALKMQKMGLLGERGGSGKMMCEHAPLLFPSMKKQYNLLPEHTSETNPEDAAYAYSGYAPLLVRMIEEGDKTKWVGWTKNSGSTVDGKTGEDRTAIFVVGGLTRAEIAGLVRMPHVSLVLTSSVITGEKLLDSITPI